MITRLISCRRGVVSLEAAIVFPVLIMLVMGAMDFALLLFTYNSMQAATREVTRQLAVNFTTPGDVEAAVRARLPNWSRDDAAVVVAQSAPANPETNVFNVVVTMPALDATPLPFFIRAREPWDLRTEVTMKQELPL